MTKANMRTSLSDSVESPELPHITLKHLIVNVPENYKLSYNDADNDNILFEFIRDDESIVISGQIRRWQGTQSHIQFDGEVDVPPQVSLIRKTIFALIVGIPTIYWLWNLVLPGLLYLLVFEGNILKSDLAVSALLGFLTSLSLLIFFMPILAYAAKSLILHDSNVNKRWQRQQELHQQIEVLKRISEDMDEVDTSRLADHSMYEQNVVSDQLPSKSIHGSI